MKKNLPYSGLDLGEPFGRLCRDLRLLVEVAETAPPAIQDPPNGDLTISNLLALAKRIGRKPLLGLTGPFDGGKSTLANALLGAEDLPAAYQPMTRLVTYVRHLSERPVWMKEDVWILDSGFDPSKWENEDHCQHHCVVAGNIEILKEYGVHEGREVEGKQAQCAVVYLDSPVLRACTIVDLPGYDNDATDTKSATTASITVDIVAYLCPFVSFMRGNDIARLAQILRKLPIYESDREAFPCLGNLFVVATHAAPHIPDAQIKQALDRAAQRVFKIIGETVLIDRGKLSARIIDHAALRARFFPFYVEIPERRAAMEQDLSRLLGTHLPAVWRARADREIQAFRAEAIESIAVHIDSCLEIAADIRAAEEALAQFREAEPARRQEIARMRRVVGERIEKAKSNSLSGAASSYGEFTDIDAVVRLIKENYPRSKEAQEFAAGHIVEMIQSSIERRTACLSEEVSRVINEFLGTYRDAQFKLCNDRRTVSIPFNAEGAFAGGLVGAAGVGALAAWAASLGNLGAYIIAAKVVSFLSSLGISVGGTAGVMSTISAIGGPVTIAIAIVVIAIIAGWALLGTTWQVRLARKIVETFREQNLLAQWQTSLTKYWQDTADAFSRAADAVEHDWEEYLSNLERVVSPEYASRDETEARLRNLERARDFFSRIPWRGDGTA